MEISQDEGVNDFLQRIKELGDKRNREDNERNRKLEEEILAGRQARQARRAGMLLCTFLDTCTLFHLLPETGTQQLNAY